MKIKFNSIRFKISVLYTVVLFAILLFYSTILYFSLSYTLYSDFDQQLVIKARDISSAINSYLDALGYKPLDVLGHNQRSLIFTLRRIIREEGDHPNQNKVAELEKAWQETRDRLGLREDYINFATITGKPIINSNNLGKDLTALFLKDMARSKDRIVDYQNIKYGHRRIRVISVPFYYQNKKLYVVQVGTSLGRVSNTLQHGLFFIALSIPLVLLPASFFGRIITVRILNPVREITSTARNITYKDLSVRVKKEHADEEMQYLVDAFNDMISRLDRSFKYIAEFSSDVAHELKTPLAIIRGEAEVALREKRDPEEYIRVLQVSLEETERMRKTVEDLLLLTRLDYIPEVFNFDKIDFMEFFGEIYEAGKKFAAQKNIVMKLDMSDKPTDILADKLHLRRLFFNLINNAIKFTDAGGNIDLAVKRTARQIIVSVSDTGVGIAEKDREKIFNRFYRINKMGEDVESGSGLGLSIAQSIAKMHHGNIEVKSQLKKGSTFTVTLPLPLA